MRFQKFLAALLLCWIFLSLVAQRAQGGNATFLTLPYSVSDSAGNRWTIFQNGMLQQRGNQPVYGQGAMLLINGEGLQSTTNRVNLDEQTGELVFENLSAAGITITRRVLVKADDAYVRYIDILKNPTAQDQMLDVQLQTRLNFQLIASQSVPDPGVKDRVLAWVGQTQMNRAAVEFLAGRSAKNAFGVAWQQENNLMQADMTVKLPAGAEIAFMHIHATAASLEAGTQLAGSWKESALLKNIPPDIRKVLVNFNSGLSFVGDTELLRGDLLDVVELRGGDQLKGTLKEPTYSLHTFYGGIELPADRITGLINVGAYHPRQLLVTDDGQVFGGELVKQNISIELSSGQLTQVPLSQIARMGYRKRAGESDDDPGAPGSDHPILFLRTGDRMAVLPPEDPIDFMTRYGLLKLDPKAIEALAFQSDDNAVHTAYLTDGSHIAGLVAGEQFKITLSGTGSTTRPAGAEQSVTIPAAALSRWQLTSKAAEPEEDAPTLRLANGDLFVGSITGQLQLDTVFDTITVNAGEIHSLVRAHDAGNDVQIELWDQTRLSGSLREPELMCALNCGQTIKAPVALIDAYLQPQPRPSEMMVQQIKTVVANLAADDWKQRDQAQSQLTAMGPMVVGVLKQLLPSQPPEAQQRLEAVLKQFADKKRADATRGAAGGADASPGSE